MKLDPPAADPIQTEETARIGLIDRVTDIKAVADYVERIAGERRANARTSSIRKVILERSHGSYAEVVGWLKFDQEGNVSLSDDELVPTADETAAIQKAWKQVRFPEYQPCLFTGRHLPRNDERCPWSKAEPDNIAVCWDVQGQHILCVEERRYLDDRRKAIVVWSHFDDGKWRIAEPDALPLYGLDTIRDASTIMVHEGPKAAKAVQALVADDDACSAHPFGRELRGYRAGAVAHVAWLGGAERPTATDWSPLAKSSARIVVVADNDDPGRNSVPAIARAIGREMWMIQFDARFRSGFDLADPIPDSLFTEEADGEA